MIHETLSQALSSQVNAEFYSSYLYLSMSAQASARSLKGFANWLYVQAQEELAHAAHMYRYIIERGAVPALVAIEAPPAHWDTELAIFENVRAHEAHVTALINDLASLAMDHRDHALYQYLTWFVGEQVEEEATAEDIVQKLKLAGDNKALLVSLDAELGARVFVDPFAAAGNKGA